MSKELLIVKSNGNEGKFKVVDAKNNMKHDLKYEKLIYARNAETLSFVFNDLETLGYPVEKAFKMYRLRKKRDPDIFFP